MYMFHPPFCFFFAYKGLGNDCSIEREVCTTCLHLLETTTVNPAGIPFMVGPIQRMTGVPGHTSQHFNKVVSNPHYC